MNLSRRLFQWLFALCCVSLAAGPALAQAPQEPYQPIEGQAGKDVVWVPTPQVLVEKMLDMARVTPQDFVMDLGSGDGRNIIAAAKRGARALGVEYNPEMVALSKRTAAKEGVADKAMFVQGDMFEADVSRATVLALFLLDENLQKLIPKFLDMRPGTRIVSNTYRIEGWDADETSQVGGDCLAWCTAHLYIVPARVAGNWRLPQGVLTLKQDFQKVSGTLSADGTSAPVANGRLRGNRIQFVVGATEYSGRVSGDTMQGEAKGPAGRGWTAARAKP